MSKVPKIVAISLQYLQKTWGMKLIFCLQINTKLFYKLVLSFWVCVDRQSESTQNNKFAYLWNLSRKVWGMKLIFWLQINTKVFYKLIVSLWVCIVRHTQSTQNNKFSISLQYLKENVKDEVDFLPANKYQRQFCYFFAIS